MGRTLQGVSRQRRYLLQCHRYIVLNPLRAKMITDPADDACSNYRRHALGAPDPLITPHPALARLDRTAEERRRNYPELVMQAVDPEEADTIRWHLQHQRIYGPDRFRLAIERQLVRKLEPKNIGRPKRPPSKPATC